MKEQIYTNLFMENAFIDKLLGVGSEDVYFEREIDGIKICRVTVENQEDEIKMNCRRGTHVTLYTPKIWSVENRELDIISNHLSNELQRMLLKKLGRESIKGSSFLVIGLGNRNIASDSIGPLTVDKVTATRAQITLSSENGCSVCAVQCGVMGETGIGSAELARALVGEIGPDAVIAVDSLAAKACERLGATVQISDSGITPGAGIGNRQHAINRETLGVPVLAIGVPTVVSAASLVYGTLEKYKMLDMLKEGMGDFRAFDAERRFFVSPKECDLIAIASSYLISSALNKTFDTE